MINWLNIYTFEVMKTILLQRGLLFSVIFCYNSIIFIAQNQLKQVQRVPLDSVKQITRIAFGSCNHQSLPQEMWENILVHRPDIWVWLGDAIYGDTKKMDKMKQIFNKQLSKPNYVTFLKHVPVIGIWDDHDYGGNNVDKTYPMKRETQQLFLDFLGEPINSPRRSQEGIYTSYVFGEPGKQVKFILLDVRYHKEKPGDSSDILGEAQWNWLEKELRNSSAQIHLIATGTQFVSDKKTTERWLQFPRSVKRMYELIRSSAVPGVIFLSGDIHCGEMMVNNSADLPYPIYEFTSSGLTHGHWGPGVKRNSYKIRNPFCGRNYGLITINWNEPVSLKVELRDIQDFVNQEITIYLEDLRKK